MRSGLESRVVHVSIELPETPGDLFTDKLLTISLIPLGWTAHQCTTLKLAGLPSDVASIPEPITMGYGFDDGPNFTHNIFYDYLQSQNQKAAMFWTGRWRRSALLWMIMRFVLVSASFFWHSFHDVDFLFRVTDTWSHRYSEFL